MLSAFHPALMSTFVGSSYAARMHSTNLRRKTPSPLSLREHARLRRSIERDAATFPLTIARIINACMANVASTGTGTGALGQTRRAHSVVDDEEAAAADASPSSMGAVVSSLLTSCSDGCCWKNLSYISPICLLISDGICVTTAC